MTTELGLTEHHQQNLIEYLKFCRLQRQARINMVLVLFDNAMRQKLSDETYTKEEVLKLLSDLKEMTRCELESELINISHMDLLLFRQLSAQAEKHHINLFMNLSELEDRQLLDAVQVFETEHFTKRNVTKTVTILQKLVAIEGTVEERTRRDSEIAERMRNELEKCELEMNRLQKASENDRAQQQKLIEQIELSDQRLLATKQQLELKESELEKKFANTNTYKTMQHILKQKNKTIGALRELVAKHNIEDSTVDDDTKVDDDEY